MTRLLLVEVQRDLRRRTTWALLAIAGAGILLFGILLFVNTDEVPAPVGLGRQRAQFVEQCVAELGSGKFGPGLVVGPDGQPIEPSEEAIRQMCEDNARFSVGIREPLRHTDLWPDRGTTSGDTMLGSAAFFLLFGALVGGASMIGAEWEKGTMGTTLTWEPRRVRLWSAKLGAVVALSFLLSLGLIALFSGAFWITVATKGSTAGIDGDWWDTFLGAAVRLAAVAAGASGLGATLAMIGRRTSVAVGAVFVYLSVIEGLLRALRPKWHNWTLAENLFVVVTGAQVEDLPVDRTVVESGLTLLLYLGILVAAAAVLFRQRDVAGTS